jgi:NADH dehydrogenase
MVPGLKPGLHGAFWFLLKVGLYLYVFMWLRFTFPRYRFDQLMRLGWQFLIPLSIINVMGIGVALALHRHWGWSNWTAFPLTTVVTLLVAGWLGWAGEKKDKQHVFVGEI